MPSDGQSPELMDQSAVLLIEFYTESGQRLTATVVSTIPENIEETPVIDDAIFVPQDQIIQVSEKSALLESCSFIKSSGNN